MSRSAETLDRGFSAGEPTQCRRARRFWGVRLVAVTLVGGGLLGGSLLGCGGGGPQQVVVYTALDEEFSKPIFDAFTRQTGVEVLAKFDTESTKTVGLAEAIRAERDQPRCDLFWNNEALHTLRLAREGLLRSYPSPRAVEYPPESQDPGGRWYGFAARARVLIVNTNRVPEARRPDSIRDLVDVQWRDQVGVAKPLFGTTATHAACLFAALGEEEAKEFFVGLKSNARIMSGNKQVARAVAAGTLSFGLTDTDDAIIELESGRPVAIIYPDQKDDELGALFIPNTLALVKDSPNQQAANGLVDYLLSADVEGRLAMGPSAQIPLNKNAAEKPRVETPETVRAMEVDWPAAAEAWDAAREFLVEEFTAGQ